MQDPNYTNWARNQAYQL